MQDNEFLEKVYLYAELLKKSRLTADEKRQIIEQFNQLKGSAEYRAVTAVRKVLGYSTLTEEIRKSANLDNSRRLLQDLQRAAREWQAKKS